MTFEELSDETIVVMTKVLWVVNAGLAGLLVGRGITMTLAWLTVYAAA